MKNVVDLIKQHFGDEPGPDLIAKLDGKLPPEFQRFREHYNSWRREGHYVPPRGAAELRPFITGDYFSGNALSLYKLMFKSSSADEGGFYEATDVIKHHLLYCHSVAIENPLQHLLFEREHIGNLPQYAGPLFYGRGGMLGFQFNGGSLFRNYLTFLSHLRPFLESNVVVLVEAHWGGVVRKPIYLPDDESRTLLADLDVETDGVFSERREDEEMEAKAWIVGCLLEYLQFVERINLRANGALDINLTRSRERVAIEYLQRRCAQHVGVIGNAHEMKLLSTLLKFRVPGLERLGPDDINSLREGSAFADWRDALRRTLEVIHVEEASASPQQNEEFRAAVRANLEPHTKSLENEVSKNSFLSKARGAAIEIGVGLVSDAFFGTMGAVTAATLARQGLLATYKALWDSRPQSPVAARGAHYALFEKAG